MNKDESLFVSVDEAARLLGISRAFAYKLVARGEIPTKKLGTRQLVPRAWIISFAAIEQPQPVRMVQRKSNCSRLG